MRKGDHLSNQLVIILMLDIYYELNSTSSGEGRTTVPVLTALSSPPASVENRMACTACGADLQVSPDGFVYRLSSFLNFLRFFISTPQVQTSL